MLLYRVQQRQRLIRQAKEPDARALRWAVYEEETPVGFVMIADEVGSPDYIPHFLWKLFIDERHQRQALVQQPSRPLRSRRASSS
jgi:predicted acetyltransferase